MDKDIAIKVEGLTKVYPIYNIKNDRMKEALSLTRKKYHTDFYALNDVSFVVKKGETIGIIGQNGSGKSTLLKILTGVLSPTTGTVTVNGKVSALLELGAGFNPEMTGLENIYLNGTIMGYTKEEMDERTPRIIDFADIGEFINQPVKMYSSGMFSRLAFAVAINVEPEILIIDEALSVGDLFFQNKCFHKLEELRSSEVTILFVSHDLTSVKQLCSRVLWVENGKPILFGDKIEVCTRYHNLQLEKNNQLFQSMENNYRISSPQETIVARSYFPKLTINNDSILSSRIDIRSFFITNPQNDIVTLLEAERKYKIHIISENHEDIRDVIYGITLENNKGICIASLNSFANNKGSTISILKETITEIILELEMPKLQRGEYLVSVAIAEGTQRNHRNIVWLHNILSINIDNSGYNISLYEFDVKVEVKNIDKSTIKYS